MRYGPLFTLAILSVGCASSGTWRELGTEHFIVRTDLASEDAREAALAMESTRDALVSAAWVGFPFKAEPRPRVFVLANGVDFERYFGNNAAGLFFHTSPPQVYLYGPAQR